MHLKLTKISEAAFVGGIDLEGLDVGAAGLIVFFVLAVKDAHHVPAGEVAHVFEKYLLDLHVGFVSLAHR